MPDELLKDLEAVRQIPVVPTMLDVICQTTGMGFAAVARVTQDRWLACSVLDRVQFGLEEGAELKVETTICNEIRDCRKLVVIENVSEDPLYKNHHTPKMYGLQSYISVPIILKNGEFFGTLCAIDAKPAQVNNGKVIGMFTMFAELLAFHLQSQDLLERSYKMNRELDSRNRALVSANFDLDNFVYTASHDLKSPVSNIEGLLDELSEALAREPIDRGETNLIAQLMRSTIKRFTTTIRDLTTIVEIEKTSLGKEPEELDIYGAVETAKLNLHKQIAESGAEIKVVSAERLFSGFSGKNFKSVIHNLLSNAIKYRSPDRRPEITVRMERIGGKTHLTVEDNGLGIPPDKQDKVFTMFKRFHDHVEGSGLGLYIVKRMVDAANGQIQVRSTPGKGTAFLVIF
ncbi:sensor histidine kinase [Pontibacter pamirensis]|uniref:sensor histidine kinase n=1 Tax=Pontibacter pamirensis TaxID=2562824 RepID=UPI001F431776|nr:GAF domain-containing sensor histidine kinase [Pontibacter pamirensis]